MKIDMHCHVSQGSMDSKVKIEEYIEILQSKGFDGMVVTDHNTYNGYRYWKNHIKGKRFQEFKVFKGIEYDTADAGHFIVIMPEGVKRRLLETRGLTIEALVNFVHKNGGVLGPAHPGGEKYMSYTHTKSYRRSPELMAYFDFVEVYNACESVLSNENANEIADKFQKAKIGGSDAHNPKCVGMGYTEFEENISTEIELITALRNCVFTKCGGQVYDKTTKDKLGKAKGILTCMFWLYNTGGTLYKKSSRRKKVQMEDPMDAIDPIEIDYLKSRIRKIKIQKKKVREKE